MTTPITLSWSGATAFLTCPRKYELAYIENLQKISSTEKRDLLLGGAIHAGVEAALKNSFEVAQWNSKPTVFQLLKAANDAAHQYLRDHMETNKMTYSEWGSIVDVDYYAMFRDLEQSVKVLLDYHLPLIGIGTRFIVPTKGSVLDDDSARLEPAIEWEFDTQIAPGVRIHGYIDAVLWDNENNDFVVVDWKTRGTFPYDSTVLVDGQLHLYAAAINKEAGRPVVNRVMMYQMRSKPPQPASISIKRGVPNTGAASYDTTWEVWQATLPRGIVAAQYEEVMRPKLKTDDDFRRIIEAPVTAFSSEQALRNMLAVANNIQRTVEQEDPFPAVLSSNACKWCDFLQLCGGVLRYGGNAAELIKSNYEQRTGRIEKETNDVE